MEKEYHIVVNDSVFRTKRQGVHVAVLFAGCFFALFLFDVFLTHTGMISGTKREAYMPEAAFFITAFILCGYYALREKRTKGIMPLDIVFSGDVLRLFIRGKQYAVRYDQIIEVSKMMVIDRMHDQKGCYRMKIRCRGRGSLEFETTKEEYEKQLDFEQTGLSVFYDACKKAGIKCC